MKGKSGQWYKGTANAIYQNIRFIEHYDPEYVLILSGDHIYKMDYSKMLESHKRSGAACTIAVIDTPLSEASRFGIMSVDDQEFVREFEEKPRLRIHLASMGVYILPGARLKLT
jgi:glucose-1-phosphate adenylyltransferase